VSSSLRGLRGTGWLRCVTSDIRRNCLPRSRDVVRCCSTFLTFLTLCPVVEILIVIDLITAQATAAGITSRVSICIAEPVSVSQQASYCIRNAAVATDADERSRLLSAINIYEGPRGEISFADRVFRRGVAAERIVVGLAGFIEQQRPLNRDLARETQNSPATRLNFTGRDESRAE